MLRLARCALGVCAPVQRRFSAFPYASDSDEETADTFQPAATEPVRENLLRVDKKFADYVRTVAIAGKGGDGCYTFTHLRGVRRAFPAGGNGAPGGDVCIEATEDCHFLAATPKIEAEAGESGRGKDMDGRRGKDAVLKVPLGTLIYQTGAHEKRRLLYDLNTPQTVVVAKGGKGGRGNKMYSSVTEKENGTLGETKTLELELKIIADIGFVGYPNAGKTSLLASLTRSCPKIASYPFTTLRPYVGTLHFIDGFKLTIADMPGLIEGAHENKGLGHDFLKHIQRTKALVYVLDPTNDLEHDLVVLYKELRLYDERLVRKPYAIVVNKSDLMQDFRRVEDLKGKLGMNVQVVSAKFGTNLGPLVQSFRTIVEGLRPKVKAKAADYELIFTEEIKK